MNCAPVNAELCSTTVEARGKYALSPLASMATRRIAAVPNYAKRLGTV